jgi:alpha-L-fucosidase 2
VVHYSVYPLTCALTESVEGCAHAQQMIWQLFNAIEKGFAASGDTDTAFLDGKLTHPITVDILKESKTEVKAKRAKMDKGIHIGSWGQLQGR